MPGHLLEHAVEQRVQRLVEAVAEDAVLLGLLLRTLHLLGELEILRGVAILVPFADRDEMVLQPLDRIADRPLAIDVKASALLTAETRQLIGRIRDALAAVTEWRQDTTEAAMRAFAEQNGLKLGSVAQPLRVALTGRTTSPGIFDVLAVLGRDECLGRLADQAA